MYLKLNGHSGDINCIEYSPDGKFIASGSQDFTVRVWDTDSAKCLKILSGHSAPVLCLSYSSDINFLASGGEDCITKIWYIDKGTIVEEISNSKTSEVSDLKFSPDNKYLAISDDCDILALWDTESKNKVRLNGFFSDLSYADSISFSSNSLYCAFSTTMGLGLLDISQKRLTKSYGYMHSYSSIIFNPINDNELACIYNGGGFDMMEKDEKKRIIIFDRNFNIKRELENTEECYTVSYSPNGNYLAVGYIDSRIEILETLNYSKINELKFTFEEDLIPTYEYDKIIKDICFSPDSKYLAACCYKYIQVWEI